MVGAELFIIRGASKIMWVRKHERGWGKVWKEAYPSRRGGSTPENICS